MVIMNYNRLNYFHVLATEGSLKAASSRLNVTASTISEQIKLLEIFFENELFTKEKGRLRISAFGQQVYMYTSTIFETSDRLIQALHPEKSQIPNILAIDTTPLIVDICPSNMFLPVASQNYTLKLNQGMFLNSLKRLYSFETDIIISEESSLTKRAKNIEKVKIRDIKFYCCVGSELFETKEKWTIPDLNEIPRIAYSHETKMRYDIDSFFTKNKITSPISIETNEIKLIRDATANNLGFSFLPESIIRTNSKKICKVFPKAIFKVGIYSYISNNEKRDIIDQILKLLSNKKD